MDHVHALRVLSKVAPRRSLVTLQGFTIVALRHDAYTDGLPLSQLAKEVRVSSQQAVSYIVKTLGPDGLGLILKRVDPEDRRSSRLFLSPKGERLWAKMTDTPRARRNNAKRKR